MNALILTTTGRKSGLQRTTPVGYFPGEEGSWLIVASAAGAAGNPAWYYNLAAHPDKVQVEVEGRTVSVIAEQLHGGEREQVWEQIIAAAPRFAPVPRRSRPGTTDHPSGAPIRRGDIAGIEPGSSGQAHCPGAVRSSWLPPRLPGLVMTGHSLAPQHVGT